MDRKWCAIGRESELMVSQPLLLMRSVCSVGLLIVSALLVGCETGGNAASNSQTDSATPDTSKKFRFSGEFPIEVACTTGMVADIVRNIGGEQVEVKQLMGAGIDPHLYRANPGDVSTLNGADVIIYSGLHLEGKLAEIFEGMARRKLTVAVTADFDRNRLLSVKEGIFDPHVWFDVSLWSEAAATVSRTLSQFDPDHAERYEANLAVYQKELGELHEYCRQKIATIPKQQRVLVTAHDAFHYFGRAYRLDVKAIQGVSTVNEAGVKKINELVDFIVANNIKAVFVESSVPERNVHALIDGCAARNHTVIVGGELFSDAMGKAGTAEGTYIGMVRHNVDTIVKALR